MTPSTLSAGFHKCGVYPFNPDTINCGISVDSVDESDKENDDDDEDQQSGYTGSETQHSRATSEKICEQWPAEKIALFQWRYDKGYDLPDEEYMQWLDKTHPNARNTIGNNNLSLMDDFSTATPVTVSFQLATEMPHDGPSGPSPDATMASEEEMDIEASSY